MSLVIDEHRAYLADEARVSAFRRAIAEVVRPGAVVLDLASGTGILGLLACEAGARRVYSIEQSGMIEVGRAVASANGVADRVVFVQGLSSEVSLPEPVDVIVCDQIGHFGFEAGLIAYGCDARARFLKPGGSMVPALVQLMMAPVEHAPLYEQVEFWHRQPAGFDFAPAHAWAANTGYPAHLPRESLLGAPASVACLDMARVTTGPLGVHGRLIADRPGTLHGIGGWFAAQLSPSVTLSNSPLANPRLNRRNVFFPIETPVPVEQGDIVQVRMRIWPADLMVSWAVDVWSAHGDDRGGAAAKGRFRHSTLKGMLLSRDELRRMDPRFVPSLTARGDARLSVLRLCDGRRPLAEIEREIYTRHPDLFRSPGEAGAFVAEVVTRYSQ